MALPHFSLSSTHRKAFFVLTYDIGRVHHPCPSTQSVYHPPFIFQLPPLPTSPPSLNHTHTTKNTTPKSSDHCNFYVAYFADVLARPYQSGLSALAFHNSTDPQLTHRATSPTPKDEVTCILDVLRSARSAWSARGVHGAHEGEVVVATQVPEP